MISPTESSGVATCKSMGLPHLIVALGAPSRARRDVRDGPAAARVTWKESLCAKATKERRVSAVAFVGREGGVMGLVEALVQEGLDRNSAEWEIELREPAT